MAIAVPFRRNRPPELSAERQEEIREAAVFEQDRLDNYALYADYYDGRQRSRLVDRAREYLEASGIKFCENIVETAIDKAARRFHVSGFQVEDDEQASDWLTNRLWGKLDELQGVVHTETPKLGDGFVLVTWDAKLSRPRLTWNQPKNIKPVYDEDGDLDHAVKKWSTDKRGPMNPAGRLVWRLNLYYADRVEKWFAIDSEAQNWAPWRDTPDEPWPVPWTESGALPAEGVAEDALGCPVVHFREKPKGARYGRSRVRSMIPYQDELNKQVLDLFYVMDTQAWPRDYVTGVTDAESVIVAVGDILKVANENAKVGQLPAANPLPLLEAIDATLRRFSAKTDTPLFDLIKGEPPSGEALKTAESGQTFYVKDQQAGHGHSWETTAGLSWKLAWLFGPEGACPEYRPDADITAQWDSPETRNEESEARTAMLLSEIGVSDHTLMRRFGFDPNEEADLKRAESEAALKLQAQFAPPPPTGRPPQDQ